MHMAATHITLLFSFYPLYCSCMSFLFHPPQINKSSTNRADKCPQGSQWLLITLSSFLATLILQNYAMKKSGAYNWRAIEWELGFSSDVGQSSSERKWGPGQLPQALPLCMITSSLAPLCIRCCVCYMGGRHTGKVMAVTERKRYNKKFLGY